MLLTMLLPRNSGAAHASDDLTETSGWPDHEAGGKWAASSAERLLHLLRDPLGRLLFGGALHGARRGGEAASAAMRTSHKACAAFAPREPSGSRGVTHRHRHLGRQSHQI